MALPIMDARSLFTSMLIDVYKERPVAPKFFASFFDVKVKSSFSVSIQVMRGTEKIAADVERGTKGNRNSFSRSTEKLFVPPLYNEYFNATEIDLYDRLFGSEQYIEADVFADFLTSVQEKISEIMDMVSRSIEVQISNIFETGIVLLKSGDNIDFKRKAGSKVDVGAGEYFAAANANPYNTIENACTFIRKNGKIGGNVFNCIFGETALRDFLNNAKVLQRADIKNFMLDQVSTPQRDAVGGVLHGEVSCGAYRVKLWSYPEFYEDANDVQQSYWNPKKIVVLPEKTRFTLSYAGVPRILGDAQTTPIDGGKAQLTNYITEERDAHIWRVKSAPLAIPVAIDTIYTAQVVA